MKRIIVIKVSPVGDTITIGFFGETGGESRMQLTLSKSLFPDNIKQGDELILCKKVQPISIASRN